MGSTSNDDEGASVFRIGAPIVLERFPHASKTHQVKSPRSGIHSSSVEVRKKSRLNDHGCIFSRWLIVQAGVFRPVFSGTADEGAVRLRYDSPSMTNW